MNLSGVQTIRERCRVYRIFRVYNRNYPNESHIFRVISAFEERIALTIIKTECLLFIHLIMYLLFIYLFIYYCEQLSFHWIPIQGFGEQDRYF